MANSYFDPASTEIQAGTTATHTQINNIQNSLESGFDLVEVDVENIRDWTDIEITGTRGTGKAPVQNSDGDIEWTVVTDAIIDVLDEDDFASDSAVNPPSQQSTAVYVKEAAISLSNKDLDNYGETVNAIGSIGGGTQDIDFSAGNVVSATVDTSATTFTFSGEKSSGTESTIKLYLTNGGSQTVTWPASVDWGNNGAPTLTTSGVDILVFTTIDGGTIHYGFTALTGGA